jgi:hypothetical protein
VNRAAALAAARLYLMPLASLAEDVPVRRPDDSRLSIELAWGVGDRGSTVFVKLGAQDEQVGFIKVSEISSGNFVFEEGNALLDGTELTRLLRLEKAEEFQAFPESVLAYGDGQVIDNTGVEAIVFCRNYLTLSEGRGDKKRTVQRACPCDKADPALGNARALVRFAQSRFSDLARGPSWHEALH